MFTQSLEHSILLQGRDESLTLGLRFGKGFLCRVFGHFYPCLNPAEKTHNLYHIDANSFRALVEMTTPHPIRNL